MAPPPPPSAASSSTVSGSISSSSSAQTSLPSMVHVCPFQGCTKGFSKKYNLKAHLRLHTGATPFSCPRPDCDKKFKWRSSLSSHSVWHQRQDAGEEIGDSKNMSSMDRKASKESKADRQSKASKAGKASGGQGVSKSGERKPVSQRKLKQSRAPPAPFIPEKEILEPHATMENSLLSEMLMSPSCDVVPNSIDVFDSVVCDAPHAPKRVSKPSGPARRRPASRPTSLPCAASAASAPAGNQTCSKLGATPSSFVDEAFQSHGMMPVSASSGLGSHLCGAKRTFSDIGGMYPTPKREHFMSNDPLSGPLVVGASMPGAIAGLEASCVGFVGHQDVASHEVVCDYGVVGVGSENDPGSPVTSTDDVSVFQLGPVLNDDYVSDIPFLGGASVGDLQPLPLSGLEGLGPFDLEIPLEYEYE